MVKIEERINKLKERLESMATIEDMILDQLKEIKGDIKTIRGEISFLTKEVTVLKTKATIYGSIAGSVAVFVFSIIKHYLP